MLLAKILHFIDGINEWCGKIVSFIILFLALIVAYDAVLRYILDLPTEWGMELSTILLTHITLLGGGYSFLHGGQVKVDIFYDKFAIKTKALIDLFTYTLLLMFASTLIIYGGQIAWESVVNNKLSNSSWQVPLWISQIAIPIGGLLILLQGIAKWIRDLAFVVTGENHMESKLASELMKKE